MFDSLIGVPWSFEGGEGGRLSSSSQREMAEYAVRCAARHLVVAAIELARDPNLPRDRASRFSMAEAKFRALTDFDGISHGNAAAASLPCVLLPDGTKVSITDLLVGACQLFRFRLPHRSIDSELVYAAKELLSGLNWQFPDDRGTDVSGLAYLAESTPLSSPATEPI